MQLTVNWKSVQCPVLMALGGNAVELHSHLPSMAVHLAEELPMGEHVMYG